MRMNASDNRIDVKAHSQRAKHRFYEGKSKKNRKQSFNSRNFESGNAMIHHPVKRMNAIYHIESTRHFLFDY